MAIHYNAFISYRHQPEDIAAAERLHRSLERYKAPKGIREKTKPITRIFRDKDELPITSNLTDDITAALENSDYLIVICSTHTRESTWVQREIETFLKTHDRSKVLTLLVNGEPYETIPEILLREEVTDPVSGEKQMVDIEPLSCDWRTRKHRREEFLRLAAALLGCRYDDLRQRHRQYQTRRMVAIFSAALVACLCLTAYFIYTGIQIQSNLEQSQRNQSQYLSAASQERLKEGDRLTAMYLALAALPTQENERPYLPAAELALAEAIGMYDPAGEVAAVGVLMPEALVHDVQISADGRFAAIMDARKRITFWDTHTFGQIGALTLQSTPQSMRFTPDGNVLFEEWNLLSCYSVQAELLWSAEKTGGILLQEQTLLMLDGRNLHTVDLKTGETVDTLRMKAEGGTLLAFDENTVVMKNTLEGTVSMVNRKDGRTTELLKTEGYYSSAAFTEEGNVLLMGADALSMNGDYGNFTVYSPQKINVFCYDSTDGQTLWQTLITSCRYSTVESLEVIAGEGKIFCQYGNSFAVLDEKTGQELTGMDVPSIPKLLRVYTDSAKGVLEDGTFFVYDFADETCLTSALMEGGLEMVLHAEGTYLACHKLDMEVTVYRSQSDQSAQPICTEETEGLSVSKTVQSGDLLVAETYERSVLMIDLKENRVCWKYEFENAYREELLGISTDGKSVWLQDSKSSLLRLDMQTGKKTSMPLPSANLWEASSFFYDGGKIYYTSKDNEQFYFLSYDPDRETLKQYTLCPQEKSARIVLVTEEYAVIHAGTTVYLLDLDTEKVTRLVTDYEKTVYAAGDGNRIALAVDNRIVLVNCPQEEFQIGENHAVSLRFYEDELLLVCDDGALYRCDMDGTLLSRTTMHLFNTFYYNASQEDNDGIQWNFTADGELILNLFGAGNIVSCESWQARAYVLNLACYWKEQDMMLVHTNADGMHGFKRRSTQEVLALAIDQLGEFELSDEKKAFYGIE